jgi:hypothetical protein
LEAVTPCPRTRENKIGKNISKKTKNNHCDTINQQKALTPNSLNQHVPSVRDYQTNKKHKIDTLTRLVGMSTRSVALSNKQKASTPNSLTHLVQLDAAVSACQPTARKDRPAAQGARRRPPCNRPEQQKGLLLKTWNNNKRNWSLLNRNEQQQTTTTNRNRLLVKKCNNNNWLPLKDM